MNSEKNIEHLLKKLSEEKEQYPKELLEASRAAYLSKVSSVVDSGPHLKMGNRQGQNGALPTSAPMTPLMKVVLTALVAAIVALATYLAVIAYENWDKIQESLFGVPPAGETSPAPAENLNQAPNSVSTFEISISPVGKVSPNATAEPAAEPQSP